MDDPTKVSAQPVPAPVSPGKDSGFAPTTSIPSKAPVKSSTEDSIEKILDELEQEYKKKPVAEDVAKTSISTNVSETPNIAPRPNISKVVTGATIPDTTIPTPKKIILPPVQNAPQNNSSGGGLLKKLGGTKFVVGAIGLFLAIGGLTSVVMLSQRGQDLRQQAQSGCGIVGSAPNVGCWCSNGGWQWHCGNGSPGQSELSGCERSCSNLNNSNPQDDPPPQDPPPAGDNCQINDNNDCGHMNQGLCTRCVNGNPEYFCKEGERCGNGCYPAGYHQCGGTCYPPESSCESGDPCSGVSCETDYFCNAGMCVPNDVILDDGDGSLCSGTTRKFIKYSCPQGCGSDGQCTGSDSGASSSEVSSSTVLGTNECGQIDIVDGSGNYCQVKQIVCSGSCGTSTPPPSNPPSSPNPTPTPGSPICVGLTSSIATPTLGSEPVFTCAIAQTATRYEFRWRFVAPGDELTAYTTLAPSAANSNISAPLEVNASGVYTVQCRPCNGNGCANWENF